MSNVIDFSNAEQGYRDYGGSDSKASLLYNGEHYMIKFAETKVKTTDIATSESNSIFSEYISSHIAQSMGLQAHDTYLGYYMDEIVVACKDFVPDGYKLQEFDWFMRTVYRKSEIGRIPSYNQIYGTINNSRVLSKIQESAIEQYWDTFILDSLIGNFDRHKGNWGYLVNEKTQDITIAPIYDCGSSLYPALSERGFDGILSNEKEIYARIYDFPKAALNKNDNPRNIDKFGYYEMLSSNFDENCTKSLIKLAPRINLEKINNIIDKTPLISEKRKLFYKEMLRYRKELIIDKALEQIQSQSATKNVSAVRKKSKCQEYEPEL